MNITNIVGRVISGIKYNFNTILAEQIGTPPHRPKSMSEHPGFGMPQNETEIITGILISPPAITQLHNGKLFYIGLLLCNNGTYQTVILNGATDVAKHAEVHGIKTTETVNKESTIPKVKKPNKTTSKRDPNNSDVEFKGTKFIPVSRLYRKLTNIEEQAIIARTNLPFSVESIAYDFDTTVSRIKKVLIKAGIIF